MWNAQSDSTGVENVELNSILKGIMTPSITFKVHPRNPKVRCCFGFCQGFFRKILDKIEITHYLLHQIDEGVSIVKLRKAGVGRAILGSAATGAARGNRARTNYRSRDRRFE